MSRCRGGVIPKRGPGDVCFNARSGTISRHPRCLAVNDITVFVGSDASRDPVCTILLFFCFPHPHLKILCVVSLVYHLNKCIHS